MQVHMLICTPCTGRLDLTAVLCSFTTPIRNRNLSVLSALENIEFFLFPNWRKCDGSCQNWAPGINYLLVFVCDHLPDWAITEGSCKFHRIGGWGKQEKNPKSCESKTDKQWITKNTDKAVAKRLARLVAVSNGEMWHNKNSVIELGQP